MTFSYTYRSSDGVRHTDKISAETRDAAFSALRERGIKPIKVVAADGSKENGEGRVRGGVPKRVVAGLCVVLALVVGGMSFWLGSRKGASEITTVITPQGPIKYTVATPLSRQVIAGDRRRIAESISSIFKFPAEVALAHFAEPGRSVDIDKQGNEKGATSGIWTSEGEWKECLDTQIRIASNDLTEVVDLKRIVTGMKREMRAYLYAGGTVQEYFAELMKRQRLEVSYRERAEIRLREMLSKARVEKKNGTKILAAAYGYWMKSNASLKSMGIYELPLPEALREYQTNMDFDE